MATQYDVHTCGSCKVEFLSIESFIHHKQKSCLFLQPDSSEHRGQEVLLVLKPQGKTNKGSDLVNQAMHVHKSSQVKIKSSSLSPVRVVGQNSPPIPLIQCVTQLSPVVQSTHQKSPIGGRQPMRFGPLFSPAVPRCHIVSQNSSVVQSVPNSSAVPQISPVRQPIRYIQQKSLIGQRTHRATLFQVGNATKKAVFPSQTLSRIRSSQEINQALEFLKTSASSSPGVHEARQPYSQAHILDAQNTATVSDVVVEPAQGSQSCQSIREKLSCDSLYITDDLPAGTSEDEFATKDLGATSHPEQDGPLNQALEFLKPTEESIVLQEFYDEQVKKEVSQMSQSIAGGYVSDIPTRLCCIQSSKDSSCTQGEGEVGQLINQALFFLKPAKGNDGESVEAKTQPKKKRKLIRPVHAKDPELGHVDTEAQETTGLDLSEPAGTATAVNTGALMPGNQDTLISNSKTIGDTVQNTWGENQSQPCRQNIPDSVISRPDSNLEIFEHENFVNQGAFFLNPDGTKKPSEEQIRKTVEDVQTLLVLYPSRALTAQPSSPVQSVPSSAVLVSDSVQVGETGGVFGADTSELVPGQVGDVLTDQDRETDIPINQAHFFLKSAHETWQPTERDISLKDLSILVKNAVKSTQKDPGQHDNVFKKTRKKVHEKRECQECGSILRSELSFIAHQVGHDDKRCQYCYKVFHTKGWKERHEHDKHNIGQSKCEICGKVCKTHSGWKTHMKSHEQKLRQKFHCGQCDRKYDSEFLLEHHRRRHEGKDDCALCGKICKTERIWKVHMMHHNPTVSCEDCDKKFVTRVQLSRHRRHAHRPMRLPKVKKSSNRPNQKCEICDRVFFWPESFRRHKKIHEVGPSKVRKPKWTKVKMTENISASVSCGDEQPNDLQDCETMLTAASAGTSKDTTEHHSDEESGQLSEEDSDDTLAMIREAVLLLERRDPDESDARETAEPEEVQFVAEVMPTGAVNLKVTKRKREEIQLTGDVAEGKQVEKKSTDKVAKKRKVENTDDVANDSDTSGLTEGVNNLRCVLCKQEFANELSFITHDCMTIKPLTCKHCEKKFNDLVKFRLHLKRHRLIRYDCDKCDLNFRSLDIWQRHMKEHEEEGGKRHKCESCVMEFFHEENLLLHARKHAFRNVHECGMCPRVYMAKHALKKHEESHVKPEYFQCKICLKNFVFKAKFVQHAKNCRQCRACHEIFEKRGSYLKHVREFHPVFHVCEYCGKKSKGKKTHLKHLGRHANPLMCKVCHRVFKFKCQLVDHEVIHFSDRPFKCTFCEKTFKVERARISHEHICHPTENPWKCKQCGETFLQRFDFRMHVQSCSELAS
ncbi:uncharacterized protein LOC135492836 isoform X2 [Lineus longissimus]